MSLTCEVFDGYDDNTMKFYHVDDGNADGEHELAVDFQRMRWVLTSHRAGTCQ